MKANPLFHQTLGSIMPIDLLTELKKLQHSRSDSSPFAGIVEFNSWADKVIPLLEFDKNLQNHFRGMVLATNSAIRFKSAKQELENINNLIGIVNQAVISLEYLAHKATIILPLEVTEKMTLKWIWAHAHWSLYPLCLAALSGMFALGYNLSSIVASSQQSPLSTITPTISDAPPAKEEPKAMGENIKPNDIPALDKSIQPPQY